MKSLTTQRANPRIKKIIIKMNSAFTLNPSDSNNNSTKVIYEIVVNDGKRPSKIQDSDKKIKKREKIQCPHCNDFSSRRRQKVVKHIKKRHCPR